VYKHYPFLTAEKGFLPVGQITLGLHIVEANGQTGIVSGWKVVPGVKTMYNLEVALDHTFVVGMWIVHNCEIGRSGAFRSAKRDAGIPMGQQPDEVRSVGMTDKNDKSILDEGGMPIQTREYIYTREDGTKIVIQDHSAGHQFGEGGVGDQGSHFNVRPSDDTRNGSIPGAQEHYPF
jgi:HNH/Endo VII superfamily nuclease toxins